MASESASEAGATAANSDKDRPNKPSEHSEPMDLEILNPEGNLSTQAQTEPRQKSASQAGATTATSDRDRLNKPSEHSEPMELEILNLEGDLSTQTQTVPKQKTLLDPVGSHHETSTNEEDQAQAKVHAELTSDPSKKPELLSAECPSLAKVRTIPIKMGQDSNGNIQTKVIMKITNIILFEMLHSPSM